MPGRSYSSGNDGKLKIASMNRRRIVATLDHRKDLGLGGVVGIGRRASVVICRPLTHLVPASHPVLKSLVLGSRDGELLRVRSVTGREARKGQIECGA